MMLPTGSWITRRPSRTVAAVVNGQRAGSRLLENLGRRCGLAGLGCRVVALRGPGGRGSVTACRLRAWLSNDVLACRDLAVAWLKEARALSGPGSRRARHGPARYREEEAGH